MPLAQTGNVNVYGVMVSDTHKARRPASPGHHTGWCGEQNCSGGCVSNRGCSDNGDRCFQFRCYLFE
jgi:hypothetical protein